MSKLNIVVAVEVLFLVLFATSAYAQETVTLTVNSAYGRPDPSVGVHSYAKGTEITASVAAPVSGGPGVRYACAGWKAKGSAQTLPPVGFANTVTFSIVSNTVFTWKWKTQYLLTLNVEPVSWAGHIDFYCDSHTEEPSGTYPPTEGGYWTALRVVQLYAVENEGYDLAYWSGGSGAIRNDPTLNPTAQKMRRPETITANFVPEPRYFTVASAQGEPNPAVGTHQYYYDETVNANCGENPCPVGEGARYICTGHTGTGDVSDGPETSISFIIHHDSSVAWLWQLQYLLTIDSPYGEPVGAGWYDAGATAIWSAISPWIGDTGVRYVALDPTSGAEVMDAPKTVTITWKTQYYLMTSVTGGMGSVSPPSGWHDADEVVSCLATPASGWGFRGWSGDLAGADNPQDVIMDAPKTVAASFFQPTLTVCNPRGFGTPSPAEATYIYAVGTEITCSISPAEVHPMCYDTFTEGFESEPSISPSWTTGGISDWFRTTSDKHSGNWSAQSGALSSPSQSSYIQRTFAIGAGGGQVTFWWKVSSPSSLNRLTFWIDGTERVYVSNTGWVQRTFWLSAGTRTLRWECSRQSAGMSITAWLDDITVTNAFMPDPNAKYVCTGYTGTGSCPSGSGTSVTFTIQNDSSITWNWLGKFKLFTSVNPAVSGTLVVEPLLEWYDEGSYVTLTATANAGYGFAYWSGDLSGNENPKSLIMNGRKNATANFAPVVADFTASPIGGFPPLTVQFTDKSTGIVSSWEWDFDNDGTVDSTEQNPSYTYTDAGLYTVKLSVTGVGGSDDEVKLNYITVSTIWAKSYGGRYEDYASSFQQTIDGGYIVAGSTDSLSTDGFDFWVLKLNGDASVAWEKAYARGSGDDWANSIQQTSDGGYIVAGSTWVFDSQGGSNYDFWVLKLNSDGTVAWQKRYGGADYDRANFIQQISDGGYIVTGYTSSSHSGGGDFWVLKLNSDGTVAWQKKYGGAWGVAYSIQQTSDGGYIVAGYTERFGAVSTDFWVLKLNAVGNISWQKRYGMPSQDCAYSIQQTSDGGYIVVGHTYSFEGTWWDFWVLKLNSDGTVAWQKRYGGGGSDFPRSIRQTSDGGYVLAGSTTSFGAGYSDFWVLKLDPNGQVFWQKRYGGSHSDGACSIQQTSDGGYAVTGMTWSFGDSYYDFWVLKLACDGTIAFNPASGATMTDTNVVPVDTNCTVANTTATVTNTSATVTNTNCTVTDTNATVQQQAP